MVSGGMPVSRVRVTPSPGKDRSTVNDELTSTDESSPDGLQSGKDKEGALLSFFPCRPIADHPIATLVYEARAWCTCTQLAPSEEILLLCDSVRLRWEPESLMRELENIG
jgi:hypothetical protein